MFDREIQALIDIALEEDIGSGDITTEAIFGEAPITAVATIIAKQDMVVAGLGIAKRVFRTVEPRIKWKAFFKDGDFIPNKSVMAKVSGSLQSVLKGERTALNFIQRLSGISTCTNQFVRKAGKYPVKILGTRKTTPGMRSLQKYAIRMGGGVNHRRGLYDWFLIKENHLKEVSVGEAIERAKMKNRHKVLIEIEIRSKNYSEQVEEAIVAGANIIMLDNFSPEKLKKAVRQIAGRVKTEASGGINLMNIVDYAKTGVDYISIGALTHSAPAVDISLIIT